MKINRKKGERYSLFILMARIIIIILVIIVNFLLPMKSTKMPTEKQTLFIIK